MSVFKIPDKDVLELNVNGEDRKFDVDLYALFDELSGIKRDTDSEWAAEAQKVLASHGVNVPLTVRGTVHLVQHIYTHVLEQKKSDRASTSPDSPASTDSGPAT